MTPLRTPDASEKKAGGSARPTGEKSATTAPKDPPGRPSTRADRFGYRDVPTAPRPSVAKQSDSRADADRDSQRPKATSAQSSVSSGARAAGPTFSTGVRLHPRTRSGTAPQVAGRASVPAVAATSDPSSPPDPKSAPTGSSSRHISAATSSPSPAGSSGLSDANRPLAARRSTPNAPLAVVGKTPQRSQRHVGSVPTVPRTAPASAKRVSTDASTTSGASRDGKAVLSRFGSRDQVPAQKALSKSRDSPAKTAESGARTREPLRLAGLKVREDPTKAAKPPASTPSRGSLKAGTEQPRDFKSGAKDSLEGAEVVTLPSVEQEPESAAAPAEATDLERSLTESSLSVQAIPTTEERRPASPQGAMSSMVAAPECPPEHQMVFSDSISSSQVSEGPASSPSPSRVPRFLPPTESASEDAQKAPETGAKRVIGFSTAEPSTTLLRQTLRQRARVAGLPKGSRRGGPELTGALTHRSIKSVATEPSPITPRAEESVHSLKGGVYSRPQRSDEEILRRPSMASATIARTSSALVSAAVAAPRLSPATSFPLSECADRITPPLPANAAVSSGDKVQSAPPYATIARDAFVCSNAVLEGPEAISIGAKSILQPGAYISAAAGPIDIGHDNVVEELVVIANRSQQPLSIGDFNHIEAGCQILNGATIGDNNILQPRCVVGEGVVITNNCVICSNVVLPPGISIPPNTIVLDQAGKWARCPQDEKGRRRALQELLGSLLPSLEGTQARQMTAAR